MQIDLKKMDKIIKRYPPEGAYLTQMLAALQGEFLYLPREGLERVSRYIDVPIAQIYHVATFFKAFSLEPRGQHLISVCMGTACHVKDAPRILEKFERELKIPTGGTTKDGEFSLEKVRCVGCCALAPVVRVDDDTYAYVGQNRVRRILKKYKKAPESKPAPSVAKSDNGKGRTGAKATRATASKKGAGQGAKGRAKSKGNTAKGRKGPRR